MEKVIKQARRLLELTELIKESFLRGIESKEFDDFHKYSNEYREIRREIRLYFLDFSSITIPEDEDSAVRDALRIISSGKKLPFEQVFENGPLKGLLIHEFDNFDYHELEMEYFYSWLGPVSYIEGLFEISPLIAKVEVIPDELDKFFDELRQCFAFQQYLAVCVLCRTVIEISLRHICSLEGLFDPDSSNYRITRGYYDRKAKAEKREYRVIEDYQMQPSDLRYLLCQIPSFKQHDEQIRNLYSELSRIVHGNTVVKQEDAKKYAFKTIDLIHSLYEI